MNIRLMTLGLAALLMAAPAVADDADVELARELLDGTDDIYRGTSSVATMKMNVKTERWTRSLTMKSWSKGEEKSLVRIVEPAKEAGVTTLKVGENIWNYLPKVDRTMKVPAGLMSGSWMGSHFSNDDLVKESRMADDFTFAITERPDGDKGNWVVECTVKEDAAVVWGKVLVKLRPDRLPEKITYYDEKDVLVRTMSFQDYREIDGRMMPSTMRLTPEDKPGEYTEVIYDDLSFSEEVPDSMFTLQALKE
ncbi:MAG: outer membrane lipoprotein-sorting protein [Deltaproteobacteria bacterium]|nr:outer membrane lipoprotein-sorting protein [Deltaproteobacteria bacterium]